MKRIVLISLLISGFLALKAQKVDNPFRKTPTQSSRQVRVKITAKNTGFVTEKCLTHVLHQEHIKHNLAPQDSLFERGIRQEIEHLNNVALKKGNDTLRIPVIVHIVHNGESIGKGANISQQQVESQIEVLNNDFRRKVNTPGFNKHSDGADTKIEFVLALRDENGKALLKPGINRIDGNQSTWDHGDIEKYLKPATIWDPTQYMNVWVVAFGGQSSGLLGYAQFPSLSNLDGLENNGGLSTTDGVVVRHTAFGTLGSVEAPYNGGRTATHEVGHWLGLRHIWGDGDCYEDDYCDDTPRASEPNYNCKRNNSCSKFSGNDMIENYMDYTPDGCMNVFTKDQKQRMRAVLSKCHRRKELINSDVAETGSLPIALFTADKTEVCKDGVIQFSDLSVNNPIAWSWRFFDANTKQTIGIFTTQNPSIRFNRIGVYGLSLVVNNGSGIDSIIDSNYVSVLSSGNLKLPYNEDFETLNTFEDWVLYNPDNDRTWHETSDASQSGDWSLKFDNYSLDNDPSGNLDAIFSPAIDLSNNSNVYLSFDMAYAQYDDEYSDSLAIYITDDCGETFYILWKKGGEDLATAEDTLAAFVPTSNQWVSERIYLGDYSFLGSIHIAIVNWSGWGNNLYLDNLDIFSPTYSAAPSAYFWSPRDTVTVGSKVIYGDYSSNFPTQWSWTFEGGNPGTSTEQTVQVTYPNAGTYNVSLRAANPVGSDVYSVTDYITVVAKPSIQIKSSDNDNRICDGDSVLLTASGGITYEWTDDRGNLLSIDNYAYLKPSIDQGFYVTGKDRHGGVNTASVSIEVETPPIVYLGNDTTIKLDDDLLLSLDPNLVNIRWSDNSSNNTLSFKASNYGLGTHTVMVYAENLVGCSGSDTISITVIKPTGFSQSGQNEIKVYPNPTTGKLSIETHGISQPHNVLLYDATGRMVQSHHLNTSGSLQIAPLAKGYYHLELRNNEQALLWFEKVIVY